MSRYWCREVAVNVPNGINTPCPVIIPFWISPRSGWIALWPSWKNGVYLPLSTIITESGYGTTWTSATSIVWRPNHGKVLLSFRRSYAKRGKPIRRSGMRAKPWGPFLTFTSRSNRQGSLPLTL